MKIPNTDIDIRFNEPPEKIELRAHSGVCKYCGGVVKMMRDIKTAKLQPNNCQCLLCGQPYYVEIVGSIDEWEINQWRQKAEERTEEADRAENMRFYVYEKELGEEMGKTNGGKNYSENNRIS